MKPIATIVGRSNVGKSTLFNKIAEKKISLTFPEPGTTRDVLETSVSWRGKKFLLSDTGGLDPSREDEFKNLIIHQAKTAQKQADIILFMVDVEIGVLAEDERIAKDLRKLGKKILLVVNKCDNSKKRAQAKQFERLNLPMYFVSAINGSGVGDLLDIVVEHLPKQEIIEKNPDVTLALIGKPNVGKSSILNSLFGSERMIVSEAPHTTRDSQDVDIEYEENLYKVIDTAGIRRKTKNGDDVENLSINKSLAAIARSDVAALIIDISEPLTSQDHRLAREIENINNGLFIVANKWDKIPDKDDKTIEKYKIYIDSLFPNLNWVPIVFTSATDNKRIKNILLLAKDIAENLKRKITENALDKFLKSAIKKRKPTIGKGTRRPRLLSLKQSGSNPPSFALEIPTKTNLAKSYQQYLINALRTKFDFEGVPLRLNVREREMRKDEMNMNPPRHKRVTHRHRRI